MFNVVMMSMIVVSVIMAVSSAVLCNNNKTGWYWFLIASVMSLFCSSSLFISIELTKAMNLDMSQLIKPQVNNNVELPPASK